jgi:GDP-4-dehydro-6-deoxy-D-mannose reductase
MNVLVTGAGGFAGGHLLDHLRAEGDGGELFGLGRQPPEPPAPREGVRWLTVDLLDAEATLQAVQTARPSVLYHLAGFSSGAGGDRTHVYELNVQVTLNLLHAVGRLEQPIRVMLASTGHVYGFSPLGEPATEETPVRPKGVYAQSKAEMERRALAEPWGEGVEVVIARPFNHTGPRQQPGFAIPAFARQLAEIEAGLAPPVLSVGNLESWRDVCDVRDVVRGYRLLTAAAAHGETFNVSSGCAVQMSDVLDRLVALCRVPVTVEPDPERMRPVDIPVNYGSSRKLESRTGWRAEIALGQTLHDTFDWWRRQVRPA